MPLFWAPGGSAGDRHGEWRLWSRHPRTASVARQPARRRLSRQRSSVGTRRGAVITPTDQVRTFDPKRRNGTARISRNAGNSASMRAAPVATEEAFRLSGLARGLGDRTGKPAARAAPCGVKACAKADRGPRSTAQELPSCTAGGGVGSDQIASRLSTARSRNAAAFRRRGHRQRRPR